MNSEQMNVVKECGALSAAGKIHFGEVVGRLMKAGVERYHADYSRGENTYYVADGSSCVVAMERGSEAIAETFSAAGVEAAVRAAQRGEIMYPEFTRQCWRRDVWGILCRFRGSACSILGGRGRCIRKCFQR